MPSDDPTAPLQPSLRDLGAESDDRPNLLIWQDRLDAYPGRRIVALLDYLGRISYVFLRNVAQYDALVAQMQDPAFSIPIFAVTNRKQHDELLSEVERLLHNVLTALSTRVDQQRVFIKKHFMQDQDLRDEYLARVDADFATDIACLFLKGLRNMLTHHRLPVAQSSNTISQNSYTVTFILASQPLLDWDGWNGELRNWIRAQADGVKIVDEINSYAQKCVAFDTWFFERIKLKYEKDLREYLSEAAAFDQEWRRQFGL